MKTVKDVMSTHPISVQQTASVKEMAARLRASRVSGFPVLGQDGKVAGVVSEADLLLKEALNDPDGGLRATIGGVMHRRRLRKAEGVTAGELMTSPAVTVTPDDTIEHAARLMYARRLRRLPVVDAAGQLAGIVTRADVLAVFGRPDKEIRVEITTQVIPKFSEPSSYSVIVKDGVVTLEGVAETTVIARQILAGTRQVQGVVAVRDHMAYPLREVPAAPGPYF